MGTRSRTFWPHACLNENELDSNPGLLALKSIIQYITILPTPHAVCGLLS